MIAKLDRHGWTMEYAQVADWLDEAEHGADRNGD